MLKKNPKVRLGFKGVEEIKKHPWFAKINFNTLHEQTPPWQPKLKNDTDTQYFDPAVQNEGIEEFFKQIALENEAEKTKPKARSADALLEHSNEGDDKPKPKEDADPAAQELRKKLAFKGFTYKAGPHRDYLKSVMLSDQINKNQNI